MSLKQGQQVILGNRLQTKLIPQLTTLVVAKLNAVPILELQHIIIQEMEQNPLLEVETWETPTIDILAESKKETPEPEPDENEKLLQWPAGIISNSEDEEMQEPEAPPIGFWDRIDAQVEINFRKNERLYRIARAIIDSLNELGRLSRTVEEIAKELDVDPEEVEEVRRFILREFDPPGVAAINMREALMVQLELRDLRDTLLYEALSERWDEVKEVGLVEFIKKASPDEETAAENLKILETLHLYPVNVYDSGKTEYIYPEVIFKEREGRIVFELVRGMYPTLIINPVYSQMLQSPDLDPKTKKFIREKLERAKIYVEALTSRIHNLTKVAEFIAVNQEDFLLGRSKYLKPITQSEAAETLGMAESTLSRIVRGKYAETPVGIFELRFFFSRGIQKGGKIVSKQQIKDRIAELIGNEDPDNPLTDGEIARLLKREGYRISRRTITKYRQKMGIPSIRERKRKV